MSYVYFDWKGPKYDRPMFACQRDWDMLKELAVMLHQMWSKCESIGKK